MMKGNERRAANDERQSDNPFSFGHLSFVIDIDELVLEGFPPSEKYRIGDAVQRELEKLFFEQTRAPQWISLNGRDDVDAGAFHMNTTRSEVIGAQIAQSVFQSLQNPE